VLEDHHLPADSSSPRNRQPGSDNAGGEASHRSQKNSHRLPTPATSRNHFTEQTEHAYFSPAMSFHVFSLPFTWCREMSGAQIGLPLDCGPYIKRLYCHPAPCMETSAWRIHNCPPWGDKPIHTPAQRTSASPLPSEVAPLGNYLPVVPRQHCQMSHFEAKPGQRCLGLSLQEASWVESLFDLFFVIAIAFYVRWLLQRAAMGQALGRKGANGNLGVLLNLPTLE